METDGGELTDSNAMEAFVPAPPQVPPTQRVVTVAEMKKFSIIYACYVDPAVTVANGRRLPLSKLTECALVRNNAYYCFVHRRALHLPAHRALPTYQSFT